MEKGCCNDAAALPFCTQLLSSVNRALTTILALALELDSAVNQSKQGVIAADTHINTGVDVSASLANQDVASQNKLTVSTLTPRRLASESRPFLVEPPPLWCAKN